MAGLYAKGEGGLWGEAFTKREEAHRAAAD
jgi:hypothetical protein